MPDTVKAAHTPTGYYAIEANGRMHVLHPAPSKMSICTTAKFDVVTTPDRLREEAHRIARALNRDAAHDDLVKAANLVLATFDETHPDHDRLLEDEAENAGAQERQPSYDGMKARALESLAAAIAKGGA